MANRWQDIFLHLKNKGFDVFAPAQHEGECVTPYIVINDSGTLRFAQFSSTRTTYDVMCYVPKNQFSTMSNFVDSVKLAMKELQSSILIRPTYNETPSFYDEEIKGYMVSIQYELYKQII